MAFGRELHRLLIALLLMFMGIGLAAAYWAVTGPDALLDREDNPRRVLADAAVRRGAIFDRGGEALVRSFPQQDNTMRRVYLYPETASALGYFSQRYGAGGLEAAFDTALRGADRPINLSEALTAQLLHRPQVGSDIQLTLDVDVQRTVAQAMAGQRGAAVVMAIPSGQILSMVSLPTFDPNRLDADWNTLTADPGNPFFNRVLQGRYQPGAALQTPLIAAALLLDQPLDVEYRSASQPYALDGLQLECAVRLPPLSLSLREAYSFGCPTAFAAFAQNIDAGVLQATFDTFQLDLRPLIDGAVSTSDPLSNAPVEIDDANYLQNALGQGEQTVTPLSMVMIAASLINDGNTPYPTLLLGTRPPDSDSWLATLPSAPTIPFTTLETASRLQDLMRAAVAEGAAQNAGRPNIDIGGHTALAYSGDTTLAWFIGFATLGGRDAAAVAVVLEGSGDAGLAADIGGTALQAAGRALRQSGS
ncbi:MAG: penicillin-binding transpeptidase domain-containing protein [bacterium]|nr:penicillin-binding transpeptidase domain-containing protein [bacterium]